MASSLAAPGRGTLDASGGSSTPSGIPTLKRKPNLTVVPFRHSKLTELFQDFFINSGSGAREGAVAMIVNVNPYDTGFDENAHVMRFAAVAREVMALPAQQQPPRPRSPMKPSGVGKIKPDRSAKTARPATTETSSTHRRVTLTTVAKGRKISDAQYEIVEGLSQIDAIHHLADIIILCLEEEDQDSSDGSDEFSDPLVDSLFDELEDLRTRVWSRSLHDEAPN